MRKARWWKPSEQGPGAPVAMAAVKPMEPDDAMNDRMCIVTRQRHQADDLIRFVAAPDGAVAPDLKRKLPGRGCWVRADRETVDAAARKQLFARALKADAKAAADLGALVDRLLAEALLGAIGLERKAGRVVLGAEKVEAAVRAGKAAFVLHAMEASADGVRKIGQARHALRLAGGGEVSAFALFAQAEMSLAFGASNVVHAAVLAGDGGNASLRKAVALSRYRGGFAAGEGDTAEETDGR